MCREGKSHCRVGREPAQVYLLSVPVSCKPLTLNFLLVSLFWPFSLAYRSTLFSSLILSSGSRWRHRSVLAVPFWWWYFHATSGLSRFKEGEGGDGHIVVGFPTVILCCLCIVQLGLLILLTETGISAQLSGKEKADGPGVGFPGC